MQQPVYGFRPGFRSRTGMTAERMAGELERIWEKNGQRLRPENVVEEARPPDSVLHDEFIWDDTEAANLYRLGQARSLIKCTFFTDKAGPIPEYVHVAVHHEKPHGFYYQKTVVAVTREDELRAAMSELFSKMTSLLESYTRLRNYADRVNPGGVDVQRISLIIEALRGARNAAQNNVI
jgi:hypothetical protein